jgi:hypothetical protein
MSTIVCACGRQVPTQAEWAGQWITCPGCAGALYAPFPGNKPSLPGALPEATRLCALCAETVPVSDVRCRFCGSDPAGARPAPAPHPAGASTDEGIPVLVVGLIGLMICPLLCPLAWAMGTSYEARCRKRGVAPSGPGHAGKIVGIVGSVLLGLSSVWPLLSGVARCL